MGKDIKGMTKGIISEEEFTFLLQVFIDLEKVTSNFIESGKVTIESHPVFTIQPDVFLQVEFKKKYSDVEGSIIYFPKDSCFEYVRKFKIIVPLGMPLSGIRIGDSFIQ